MVRLLKRANDQNNWWIAKHWSNSRLSAVDGCIDKFIVEVILANTSIPIGGFRQSLL